MIGLSLGRMIEAVLGADADIGGVGIAMILLILACDRLQRRGQLKAPTDSGLIYWGQMYVLIVVAMAASQNVRGAFSGGVMAALAGISVALSFVLVGILARQGQQEESPR